MYIHSTYKFLHQNENGQFYKKLLKEISTINLRRANKFNVLSVYGALKCISGINYKNPNIYIGTEYGVISGVLKVIESLNDEHQIVMPFDFLNINGNNAGFNISEAINTTGESFLTTSNNFSFEKTLQFAFHKSSINNNFEALIGGVDESLECIENYKEYVINNNLKSYDGSCWLYCSKIKENAIAKVEAIEEFISISYLNNYLENNKFNMIGLNHIAKNNKKLKLNYNNIYQNNQLYYYGTQAISDIIDLLNYTNNVAYISQDKSGKFILIRLYIF